MKWLTNMKPNSRGWLILALGSMMLYLHWVEVLHSQKPVFSSAFTTPWFIVIGLMYVFFPSGLSRSPTEGALEQAKRQWKEGLGFILVCFVVGFAHYQLQKYIFN